MRLRYTKPYSLSALRRIMSEQETKKKMFVVSGTNTAGHSLLLPSLFFFVLQHCLSGVCVFSLSLSLSYKIIQASTFLALFSLVNPFFDHGCCAFDNVGSAISCLLYNMSRFWVILTALVCCFVYWVDLVFT